MASQIIILFILIAVSAASGGEYLYYTEISYSIDGEPCLNDCFEGECYIGYNVKKSCVNGEEIAPQYFTSQTQEISTCLSRCGKYGYSYNWCFVTKEGDWDYCNNEVQPKWVQIEHRTEDICSDACKYDGKAYQCTDSQGKNRTCDPLSYEFIQLNSVNGEKCDGRYYKHDKYQNQKYFCYVNRNLQYTAPPARSPLKWFYKSFSSKGNIRGAVAKAADAIEKSRYFKTISLNINGNSIVKYTVKPPENYGYPELPLVVRATITSDIIKTAARASAKSKMPSEVTKNLKCMAKMAKDRPGNLIGTRIGGPKEIYNMVPLRPWLKKRLKYFETEIYKWVNTRHSHSVDITVVVQYEIYCTRPYAVCVDIVFKKDDKIIKVKGDKVLYNSNLGQVDQKNIIEPQIKPVSLTPNYTSDDYENRIVDKFSAWVSV